MVCRCSRASAQGHAGRGEVSHLLPFMTLTDYTVPVPQAMSRSSHLYLLLRVGTALEMWHCWSQTCSEHAEDGEVLLRWWVYTPGTGRFV